ncbi:MAG: hypothetical protein RI894_2513, partial [Bacteroidota bacterium]
MALLTVFSTAYSSFSLLNSVSNGTQSQTLIIVLLLLAAILCAIIGIAFPFLFIIAGILLVATLIVGIINLQNKREQEIAKKENTEIRKIHPLAQAGAILTTVGLAFFILGFASTLFALLGVAMLIIGAVLGI